MNLEKTLLPRLLTTQEACCYLFGEHSRSMAARFYRLAKDPNSCLKSIRLTGKSRHLWSVFELDKLAKDPISELELEQDTEVFSEKQ